MSRVLALDLGGTSLRAASAEAERPGGLTMMGRWPAPASIGGFREQVLALCAQADAAGDTRGLGVTVPGLVEGTVCRWVPNLPYLDGVDLAALLAPAKMQVVVANDAQLALLAEAVLGGARDVEDAILLAVGTGIGSAVLAAGRIVRGARGHACSFGWACADLEDGGDGTLGWLERHASGRAFDRAGALMMPPRDGAGVAQGARMGDPACLDATERIGRALGTALAGAVALLDPARVLLTGGVSDASDILVPKLLEALRRQLPPNLRGIRVESGAFGANAGLIGGAIAAARGADWWNLR